MVKNSKVKKNKENKTQHVIVKRVSDTDKIMRQDQSAEAIRRVKIFFENIRNERCCEVYYE